MYLLAGKVAETLANLKIDAKRFDIIRDKVRLDKKNLKWNNLIIGVCTIQHIHYGHQDDNSDKVKMLDTIEIDEFIIYF